VLQFGVLGERLRSHLWPIPALAAVTALALGIGLSAVRPHAGVAVDATSARSILEVLAGSSLTVVALVLSLQVVALQLAASQYSPRLLRTFARDWVVQVSMAVLIATFVFSLVTLALFGAVEQPPTGSVLLALLLGLGCVAALVAVVAHIVTSLRIETSMAELHEDAVAVIHEVYGDAARGADDAGFLGEGSPFAAQRAGFVQAVDAGRLASWAQAHDLRVRLDARAGDHVLAGQELGVVLGPGAADAVASMPAAVLIGHERTPDADPGFGLLQLGDIALRALSPGVNDPTTALHAIGHLTSLLQEIAHEDPGTTTVTQDDRGQARVLQRIPALAELVRDSCLPIVRAGGADPDVLLALVRLVHEVSRQAPEASRPGIASVAQFIARAAARDLADPEDRASVRLALAALPVDGAGTDPRPDHPR
jgi:uncharacterized membrane protein